MNNARKIFSAVLLLSIGMLPFSMQAQTVLDGAYIKEHTKTKKIIQYPHLREADVMWSKRIWRTIELKEKINHPLYFPHNEINDRKSLFQVIRDGLIVEGSITAYDPGVTLDDEFNDPMLISEVEGILAKLDTMLVPDPDDWDKMIEVIQQNDITPDQIERYQIKEDWYFDKQRSEMYVRIIGLAPQIAALTQDGERTGAYRTLFWLYFPECRYLFSNWEVYNRTNDSERRTFDDIFMKRQFSSFIHKEQNVYDRSIVEYAIGIDALLESERIKEELFLMEHDLWNF
ncbi:MAG: gliding motility protein GldN [Cryomorphaceae bacterium]|nr:MAG: gliding motility protein GldN [Cryomorphaceae bacterium]